MNELLTILINRIVFGLLLFALVTFYYFYAKDHLT